MLFLLTKAASPVASPFSVTKRWYCAAFETSESSNFSFRTPLLIGRLVLIGSSFPPLWVSVSSRALFLVIYLLPSDGNIALPLALLVFSVLFCCGRISPLCFISESFFVQGRASITMERSHLLLVAFFNYISLFF